MFAATVLTVSLIFCLTRGFLRDTMRAYLIGRTYVAGEDFGRYLPAVDEVAFTVQVVNTGEAISTSLALGSKPLKSP